MPVLLLAGLLAASCHRLIPPARPPYTVTGIVESVDSLGLALRHKSGQRIRISLGPGTAVSRRNAPASVTDIMTGMRIVVLYHFVDGAAVADAVRLFRPPIGRPT